LKKLHNSSIKTVLDFITKDLELLSRRLQLPFKDLCSIHKVLLAEYGAFPVQASSLYESALNDLSTLSTGFESLDSLLDGGLYTGELVEICGDSGAGKTLICHTSCAATVNSHHSAVYIETSCSLQPQLLLNYLLRQHPNPNEETLQQYLQNIKCLQIFDVHNLLSFLDDLLVQLKQESLDTINLKLIVLDNLATLIDPVTGGGFHYTQGLLSNIGRKLKELAVSFALSVVVTNNLVSAGGDVRKAALGKQWSHMPHVRLMLSRNDNPSVCSPTRTAIIVKSSRQKTPVTLAFDLNSSKAA